LNYIILDIETTGINTFKDEIICIGLLDDRDIIMQYYTSNKNKNDHNGNNTTHYSFRSSDEYNLLCDSLKMIKIINPKHLVGWKISKFDIPFIRSRLLKYDMVEYIKYINKLNIIDLSDFLKDFVVKSDHIRSDYLSELLGIDIIDDIHGSDVPYLYKIGIIDKILEHNRKDLLRTKIFYDKLEFLRR